MYFGYKYVTKDNKVSQLTFISKNFGKNSKIYR